MGIELATIIAVDTQNYTVTVVTDGNRGTSDVPMVFPYDHPEGGGAVFMPEVNARCLFYIADDDPDEMFIWGYMPPPHDEGYKLGKPSLTPGSMQFFTRDGNKIALHRGGVIEVQSTPLCQTLYLPLRNIIRSTAENWETLFPGGSIGLRTLRMDNDPLGARTVFQLQCKERALDPDISVELYLGGTDRTFPVDPQAPAPYSGSSSLFELRVGTAGSLFTVSIDKTGNTFTRNAADKIFQVGGKVIGRMSGGFALLSQDSGTLTVEGNVTLKMTDSLFIEAAKSVSIKAHETTVESSLIRLGTAGADEPVLRGIKFLQMFLTHTHEGDGIPPVATGAEAMLSNRVMVD